MLQEHEIKQKRIFTKYPKSVLDLISGHPALLKLTLVKTDVEELKESLNFMENDIDHRFSNINEKVQSLEKELVSAKEDIGAIQTIERDNANT